MDFCSSDSNRAKEKKQSKVDLRRLVRDEFLELENLIVNRQSITLLNSIVRRASAVPHRSSRSVSKRIRTDIALTNRTLTDIG